MGDAALAVKFLLAVARCSQAVKQRLTVVCAQERAVLAELFDQLVGEIGERLLVYPEQLRPQVRLQRRHARRAAEGTALKAVAVK